MPDVTGPYAPGTPYRVDLMAPDQQVARDRRVGDLFRGRQSRGGHHDGDEPGPQRARPGARRACGRPTWRPAIWTPPGARSPSTAASSRCSRRTCSPSAVWRSPRTPTGAVFGPWQAMGTLRARSWSTNPARSSGTTCTPETRPPLRALRRRAQPQGGPNGRRGRLALAGLGRPDGRRDADARRSCPPCPRCPPCARRSDRASGWALGPGPQGAALTVADRWWP